MLRKLTKGHILIFISIFIVLLIISVIINSTLKKINEPVEIVQNQNVKKEDISLNINGSYLIYLGLNETYEEQGATAYFKDESITDKVITSYYQNGKQISKITTDIPSTYLVKYEISSNGTYIEKTRVIIIVDNQNPSLSMPSAITITSDQAMTYDVKKGVIATDNSGTVSLECIDTLKKEPGEYIIKCKATDKSGNKTEKNRLIKVTKGITFEYDGNLKITYPEGDYTYMYSLDGITFENASIEKIIENPKGNVIALVLQGENYITSSTYYIK